MAKSMQEIVALVNKFGDDRAVYDKSWANDDPNQLLSAIFIELGELAEHYQWQNTFKKFNDDEKLEIGFEFVDVIFFLFRLAGKSDIDLEKYFDSKYEKLLIKFPVGGSRAEQHELYRKTGKNKKYD